MQPYQHSVERPKQLELEGDDLSLSFANGYFPFDFLDLHYIHAFVQLGGTEAICNLAFVCRQGRIYTQNTVAFMSFSFGKYICSWITLFYN